MSEPDLPIGFNRMNRLRQSLPLARSSSQAKLRAPGQIGTLNATTPAATIHMLANGLHVKRDEMRAPNRPRPK